MAYQAFGIMRAAQFAKPSTQCWRIVHTLRRALDRQSGRLDLNGSVAADGLAYALFDRRFPMVLAPIVDFMEEGFPI